MQNSKTYFSSKRDDTFYLGELLAACLEPNDVIVLTGDLGAGKTQFTQGVACALGIAADVVSPTFNILLTYPSATLTLNHFDLYRLEDPLELEDIDYYATLESDGVCLIEWGDRFPEELPDDYLLVDIHREGSDERCLHVEAWGKRSTALLSAWDEKISQ